MALSAFRQVGLLELSSEKPIAERIYETMIAALGGQYDVSPGTHVEASIFARALGFARTAKLLRHAWDQALPGRVLEMLPKREREYGLVPGPNATITERRQAIAARKLLPLGCSRTNVENALRALLGDDFVAYRPTPEDEAVNFPVEPTDPELNFQPPTVTRKLLRITQPIVAGLGDPQAVTYELLSGTPTPTSPASAASLKVGDVLAVNVENSAQTERVSVEALGGSTFTATFEKSHDANCLATTMPFPAWASTRRQSLIAVSAAAAADAEKRRQVHELMGRIARAPSTWAITDGAGPFKVGVGKLGITPIGELDL